MSTTDLLRMHAPEAPERLRARVLAQRPAERRPRTRLVLVLAAAVALAIAAAIAYGIAGSGEKTPSVAGGVAQKAPETMRAAAPADAAASGLTGRATHTDASLTVRVNDEVAAATTRATKIATSLGGYAQSVRYGTPEDVSYIELRIPAGNVKRALSRLAALGDIVSQRISIDDLTKKLQSQSDQIAQLQRRIAALQKTLRTGTLSESDRVLLQLQLTEAKRALAQRRHGRDTTVAAAATARVSLVLTKEKDNVVVPTPSRFDRMLHKAVGFLALEGILLVCVLIVASPFALAALPLWFRRRRGARALLLG
jgi:hypothetical protein